MKAASDWSNKNIVLIPFSNLWILSASIIMCCRFSKSEVVVRAGRHIKAGDLKKLKVSSGAEKIIRIMGILIITTKHSFTQE